MVQGKIQGQIKISNHFLKEGDARFMRRKLFCIIAALFTLAVCSLRVPAQELVRMPAGTFCTLDKLLHAPGEVQAAAVTLLPADAVLWLAGPLEPYRPVAADALGKLYVFAPKGGDLGVTLCAVQQPDSRPRIRCVNPVFSESNREQ